MDYALLSSVVVAAINSTILLGAAMVALGLMRMASASVRHQLLQGAFLTLLILPFLSLVMPTWNLPLIPKASLPGLFPQNVTEQVSAETTYPVRDPGTREGSTPAKAIPANRNSHSFGMTDETTVEQSSPIAPASISVLPLVALLVWGAGILVVLTLQLVRWAGAGFIAEMATEVENRTQITLSEGIREELQINRPIVLLRSEMAAVPMVWGIFKSYVVLPSCSDDWSSDKTEAILRHELAHIKKRDNLIHLLTIVVCALHWFNPMVWFALRRLHFERELVCDDAVLNSGSLASAYAKYLLDISELMNGPKSKSIIPAIMAHASNVAKRLLRVLNPETNRKPMARAASFCMLGIIVGLALPISAFRPWVTISHASDTRTGLAPEETPGQDTRSGRPEKSRDLFSADYYRDLKSRTSAGQRDSGLLAVYNSTTAGENGLKYKVRFHDAEANYDNGNDEGAVAGTITYQDGSIWAEEMSLYDPEDDFRLQAHNVFLDPGAPGGYRWSSSADSSDGSLRIITKTNDLELEYRIMHWFDSGDSSYTTSKCFSIDGKAFAFGTRQRDECRYTTMSAFAILNNSFFRSPPDCGL